MIEYPKDRLYLRVGVLLTQLKSYANDKGNLEKPIIREYKLNQLL
jgi:hypothetical protein